MILFEEQKLNYFYMYDIASYRMIFPLQDDS